MFNFSRGELSAREPQEHHFQKNFGIKGGGPGIIIMIAPMEDGHINSGFHHVVDGILQSSRHQLFSQAHWNHDCLLVIVRFKFGHGYLQNEWVYLTQT